MVDTSLESYGLAYRGTLNAAVTDCRNLLRLVIDILSNGVLDPAAFAAIASIPPDHYWRFINSYSDIPGNDYHLLESNAGQQIILAASPNLICINYLPDGGFLSVNNNFANVALDPTKATATQTGFRNINGGPIVGTGSGWGLNLLTGGVSICEYQNEDDDGFSMTIMFEGVSGSTNVFLHGLHVGKIIVPDNESDPIASSAGGIGLSGDALLVGTPQHPTSAAAPPGSWLVGNAASADRGSVARWKDVPTGLIDDQWTPVRVVWEDDNPLDTGLRRVAGIDKPIPYYVYTTSTGIVGLTKYVRTMPVAMGHRFLAQSRASDSMQAWLGYRYNTNIQNQVVLWSKHEQIYT